MCKKKFFKKHNFLLPDFFSRVVIFDPLKMLVMVL